MSDERVCERLTRGGRVVSESFEGFPRFFGVVTVEGRREIGFYLIYLILR